MDQLAFRCQAVDIHSRGKLVPEQRKLVSTVSLAFDQFPIQVEHTQVKLSEVLPLHIKVYRL